MATFCRDLCAGLTGACRECMTTPITRTKIYWASGITLFIIVLIIIICVSIPNASDPPKGSDALNKGIISGLRFIPPKISERGTPDDYIKTKELEELSNSKIRVQTFASKTECESEFKDSVARNIDQIDFITRVLSKSPTFDLVTTNSDLNNRISNGRIASILSVYGGHAIDSRLSVLRTYYKLGVRMMTLVADGCGTPWAPAVNAAKNFTQVPDFRNEVVKEMNRLGILIDIAGLTQDIQADVIEKSAAPVVAFGVGLASLKDNPININSAIADKMQAKNGLLMLSLDCSLIGAGTSCTLDDFTRLVDEATTKKLKIGLGGFLSEKPVLPGGNFSLTVLPEYYNKLYSKDSNKYSLSFLRGLAFQNFVDTLKAVEDVSIGIQKKNGGMSDYIFDFSKAPNTTCYSLKVDPPTTTTTTSTESPTSSTTDASSTTTKSSTTPT